MTTFLERLNRLRNCWKQKEYAGSYKSRVGDRAVIFILGPTPVQSSTPKWISTPVDKRQTPWLSPYFCHVLWMWVWVRIQSVERHRASLIATLGASRKIHRPRGNEEKRRNKIKNNKIEIERKRIRCSSTRCEKK